MDCRNQYYYQKSDISGQTFFRLTAVKRIRKDSNRAWLWLFNCECGNQTIQSISPIRRGEVKSCGCFSRDIRRGYKNDKSPQWKGDNANAQSILRWLDRHYPKKGKCQLCQSCAYKTYRRAFSDYTRNPKDYYESCMSCWKSQTKDESNVVWKRLTNNYLKRIGYRGRRK